MWALSSDGLARMQRTEPVTASLLLHIRKAIFAFSQHAGYPLLQQQIEADVSLHMDINLHEQLTVQVTRLLGNLLMNERNVISIEVQDTVVASIVSVVDLDGVTNLTKAKDIKRLRRAIANLPDSRFKTYKQGALLVLDQDKKMGFGPIFKKVYDIFLYTLKDIVVNMMFLDALRERRQLTGSTPVSQDGNWSSLSDEIVSQLSLTTL